MATSDGKEVDTFLSFAGRKPPVSASALAYYVRDAIQQISHASWWGPRTLGVVDVTGTAALAALPGWLNVLGTLPLELGAGRCRARAAEA
jgi:hypothetical protein